MTPPPALVTVHVHGVPGRRVPQALWRMARDRTALARTPGLRFARLLGTGDGSTFTVRSADLGHWALLCAWSDAGAAADFELSGTARAWTAIASERLVVHLLPLASRGRWSGQEPFGDPVPRKVTGPVASITRARIRTAHSLAFWRAVPPVAADLAGVDGLRLAIAVGEAPVGLQGTFSLWQSAEALTDFAHRRAAHSAVIRRTAEERWYAEELFARFEVLDVEGTYAGRTP
jgi:hypothetical protein